MESQSRMLSPMIYYLAASGIGKIYCCLEDKENFEDLVKNISGFKR